MPRSFENGVIEMKTRSEDFVYATKTPIEEVGEGLKRQLLGFGETILMARVEFETGAVGEVHRHEHAQVSYVESGAFDVYINGQEHRLNPGDGFYIHPNTDHGAVCREAGVLIDVFSPAREDFLEGNKS